MKIILTRNGESAQVEAVDELLDANPWYRASFEKQVQLITERFYGAQVVKEVNP